MVHICYNVFMKKNYIKMNENKNYLSLGNLFNLIKKIAKSKSSALQLEIFASIFDVKDINKTTVNNYCTGYRPISIIYKQKFIDMKKEMVNNYEIFSNTILAIMRILDEKIYTREDFSLEIVNSNNKIKELCNELYLLAKGDEQVSDIFLNKVNELYHSGNLYECLVEYLSYAILENKQPRYIQELKIKVNKKEIDEFLKIKLYEGVSYITSLKELSKKNNMYANAELGSLEFSGLITGNIDYEVCFNYYYQAALKDHPKACWMVANLILKQKVEKDFSLAWNYLNKAIELGSLAALNTMGNCYLSGTNPEKIKNKDLAIKYYIEASEKGYVFAFNNLGKIYEKTNSKESMKYYLLSADLKESWALNKVGEHYRLNGDLNTAYMYYNEAINAPLSERSYYAYYNLAKYYYFDVDKVKAKSYLEIASKNNIKDAKDLLKECFK